MHKSPKKIVPVILAGGFGTRLWPLSRRNYPKQFLSLVGEDALLHHALQRAIAIDGAETPLVVGSEAHRFLIAEHLRQAGLDGLVILEPEGRNTAPAAAVAAMEAIRAYGEDVQIVIMPADHVIGSVEKFADAVARGRDLAAEGHLVTFGVTPTSPETGYGYICVGAELARGGYSIDAFVEKPDRSKAVRYLEDGGYFWNSGIFIFTARHYLNSIAELAPGILHSIQIAYAGSERDADFLRLDSAAFRDCPNDSIDFAVMEKTRGAAVVPLDTAWSDLGSGPPSPRRANRTKIAM